MNVSPTPSTSLSAQPGTGDPQPRNGEVPRPSQGSQNGYHPHAASCALGPAAPVPSSPVKVEVEPDADPADPADDVIDAELLQSDTTPPPKRSFLDRAEAYISRLSTKNNFWHRVCSLIWLPIAAKSGIKMKRIDAKTFMAVLPFRRFNRNWYNAMAGAALLANSEIAGGMYVFGVCGGEYTVVCKHLEYKFLRPCLGPAIYRINPREAIEPLVAHGGEFNLTIDMDIIQQLKKPGTRDRRVGRCQATFHVTPKLHQKARRERTSALAKA